MKRLTLTLSIYLITVTILVSCKKNSTGKSKTELLTQAEWKLTGIDRKFQNNPWESILQVYLPCETDNIRRYKTDGTYETDEGPTKCDATYPQVIFGNWKFIENETKIKFGNGVVRDITELTETKLVISDPYSQAQLGYTFKHSYSH